LFAPAINVTQGQTYDIKAFLNIDAITSGGIYFYIDEYDAAGTWLATSKQYDALEYSADVNAIYVKTLNFLYTPGATAVKANLQIIVSGHSGIHGYLDNVQWLTDGGTTTPPAIPGDITGDGKVNGDDVAILLANWHPADPSTVHIPGDVSGDGLVNGDDAAILLANWRN
jgi:hypothetical protein